MYVDMDVSVKISDTVCQSIAMNCQWHMVQRLVSWSV